MEHALEDAVGGQDGTLTPDVAGSPALKAAVQGGVGRSRDARWAVHAECTWFGLPQIQHSGAHSCHLDAAREGKGTSGGAAPLPLPGGLPFDESSPRPLSIPGTEPDDGAGVQDCQPDGAGEGRDAFPGEPL